MSVGEGKRAVLRWWKRWLRVVGMVGVVMVGLTAPLRSGGESRVVLLREGGGVCAEGTAEELEALQELARQNVAVVRLTFRSEGSAAIEGIAGRCARYVSEMCGEVVEAVDVKENASVWLRKFAGEEKLIEGQREGIRHYG